MQIAKYFWYKIVMSKGGICLAAALKLVKASYPLLPLN